METENVFKWKHYQPDIILLTVRWYLRYNLSFRDLVEMMEERRFSLAHTTIMRWVHQYGPVLNECMRKYLKPTNDICIQWDSFGVGSRNKFYSMIWKSILLRFQNYCSNGEKRKLIRGKMNLLVGYFCYQHMKMNI